ncbi:MAG: diguanylate cyclase [Chloroflexota bacterium]
MRVLIIDNDAKQRNKISKILSKENFEVIEAEDGEKGLKALEKQPVKILISAFVTPGITSEQLVAGILAAKLDSPPFVIFLVDEKFQEVAVDCLAPVSGDYMLTPISPDGLRARMAVAKRSVELKERLEKVRRDSKSLALYDQLTGVYNRQAVYDQALAEISRSQREGFPLSVAMIEIINLEGIEKEHGPEIRDQILRYVSSAVRANVRIYDILGRWIGAKFLLMLPNTNMEDVSVLVERVFQSIETITIELPDRSRLKIDVKFGVSSLPSKETIPLYMLVEQANGALLEASNEMENQIVYFEG